MRTLLAEAAAAAAAGAAAAAAARRRLQLSAAPRPGRTPRIWCDISHRPAPSGHVAVPCAARHCADRALPHRGRTVRIRCDAGVRGRRRGRRASRRGRRCTGRRCRHAASSRKRAGVVARPAVDEDPDVVAALDHVGRDHRLPRVHRGVAPPGQLAGRVAARRPGSATPSAPRGRRGGSGRPSPGGTTTAATAPDPARRGGRAPRRRAGRRGRSRARAGEFLISMLTHAPAQLSSPSPSVGTWSGRSRQRVSAITRPSGSTASWWTTTTPSAVSRTSSSTPWAPSGHGQLERRGGVLRRQPRCAPVGDDVRHAGTVPLVNSAFVA